jgi:hypothetical protein
MARMTNDAARTEAVKATVKDAKACGEVARQGEGPRKKTSAALRTCLIKAG